MRSLCAALCVALCVALRGSSGESARVVPFAVVAAAAAVAAVLVAHGRRQRPSKRGYGRWGGKRVVVFVNSTSCFSCTLPHCVFAFLLAHGLSLTHTLTCTVVLTHVRMMCVCVYVCVQVR
jgi:hypothetical protein